MTTPKSHGSRSTLAPVTERREIAPGLVVLRFLQPQVASTVLPGQFVNVLPKVGFSDPLLRRPFSVYWVEGDECEIIIQDHGRGTSILANTQVGEHLDVLGPLGTPWRYTTNDFDTAVLVVGGVGVAAMPLLTKHFLKNEIPFSTYYGARTETLFADEYLAKVRYATDDGTKGYHGTNISLLRDELEKGSHPRIKLFACGPTPMMKAAIALADEFGVPCEVSLETEMACGVGICQGCPVETSVTENVTSGKKFYLVCTQGPSFLKEQIVI